MRTVAGRKENELPLYTFLKDEAVKNGLGTGKAKGILKIVSKAFTKKENDIKWNLNNERSILWVTDRDCMWRMRSATMT